MSKQNPVVFYFIPYFLIGDNSYYGPFVTNFATVLYLFYFCDAENAQLAIERLPQRSLRLDSRLAIDGRRSIRLDTSAGRFAADGFGCIALE